MEERKETRETNLRRANYRRQYLTKKFLSLDLLQLTLLNTVYWSITAEISICDRSKEEEALH